MLEIIKNKPKKVDIKIILGCIKGAVLMPAVSKIAQYAGSLY
jgi:hypothetical protein